MDTIEVIEKHLKEVSRNEMKRVLQQHKDNQNITDFIITAEQNKHYYNISILLPSGDWKQLMV